ncbi:DUF2911 domain-containing protein [Tunturiibacter gelidiferens]|uniref:DUF2911 domain-containing protein n=1 Tax=Tunturiibacter gelidiferens TaxID=3069689 RepID=UPI003D9BBD48
MTAQAQPVEHQLQHRKTFPPAPMRTHERETTNAPPLPRSSSLLYSPHHCNPTHECTERRRKDGRRPVLRKAPRQPRRHRRGQPQRQTSHHQIQLPRLKGRTIGTTIVPYDQVWRTGANPATTLITATNLRIGTLDVPAGTYTIYTLPSASKWLLIVNKQTGQWGTDYSEAQDLGRTPMTSKTLPAPQENMSISFEHTSGATTELHVKWATTDEYVTVKAQ